MHQHTDMFLKKIPAKGYYPWQERWLLALRSIGEECWRKGHCGPGGQEAFYPHNESSSWYQRAFYQISLKWALQKQTTWWNEILEGIFLGALPLEQHAQTLINLGIKHVINMVEPFEMMSFSHIKPMTPLLWKELGVRVSSVSTPDMKMVNPWDLGLVVKIIENERKKGRKVYVHCKAGKGRSAAAILSYLLTYGNLNWNDAFAFLKSKRPIIVLPKKRLFSVKLLAESYKICRESQ